MALQMKEVKFKSDMIRDLEVEAREVVVFVIEKKCNASLEFGNRIYHYSYSDIMECCEIEIKREDDKIAVDEDETKKFEMTINEEEFIKTVTHFAAFQDDEEAYKDDNGNIWRDIEQIYPKSDYISPEELSQSVKHEDTEELQEKHVIKYH